MKSYFDPEGVCLEGTRESILSHILNWVNAREGKRVLLVHGFAGSGKSAIANTIAKELALRKFLAGCFFCKRDISELRDPEIVIPTLAYQMSKWYEPYRQAVLSVLQGADRAKLDTKNLRWQFDVLIKKPLQQIQLKNSSEIPSRPLVFVVDAIDESGDGPDLRGNLARLLAQTTLLAPWVKFLITSRPNPEIESSLHQAGAGSETLDLNLVSTQQDIELYMKSWITKCPDLNPLWYTDERNATFADRACGLFIWASIYDYAGDKAQQDRN